MLIPLLCKRAFFKCSEIMISHLNQNHLLFFPSLHQKPVSAQYPFSVNLNARSFSCLKATHLSKVYEVDSIQSPKSATKVSRVAIAEAQDVLIDYLHATRGYSFTDAEYISKNSPHFLHCLVSTIDDQNDVARSLRRFLRYNPINEFEPFFESLGIAPSELPSVLPRGLMFLNDDYVFLDNFHALTDYGILRSRMGKIYEAAKEIFGYPSGLLSSKFQAYENLGLSKSTVIKLVTCCPSLLIGDDINSEFAMVLDWLKEMGIENDWIGDYLSWSRTYNWKRMLDAMQFLRKVGYSEKQMQALFRGNPALLFEGFGKKVYLFLGQSLKLGLKMNVICSYFIEYSHTLSNKSAKNLLRMIFFLHNIGMGADDIARILSSQMHILSSHPLKGPKTVCKELKIGKADLCQIIKDDPFKLISLASKLKLKRAEQLSGHDPSKHLEKTKFLLKLGYVENSEEMAKALKRFRGRSDQLQERLDCLVEAGFDYNVAIDLIKRVPMILNQKKDRIKMKIDFLRNILGYPLECVVGCPAYFCYDLERIIERFSMYKWVKERNAVEGPKTLSTILTCSDERFVKYFVNVHPQGPTIWKGLKRLSHEDKNY